MKQKIRQIIYDIRRQPVIGSVTIIATALSIFLFMVVAITARVKVVPFAPESCRDRLLLGQYLHLQKIDDDGYNSSASLNYYPAQKLYGDLDGVERVSYMEPYLSSRVVKGPAGKSFSAQTRGVDSEFFKIFDHSLVSGRYFNSAESDANMPVVVISESIARKAFGTTDCKGKTLMVNHRRYTVVGVVKDSSYLATTACGDIFIATGPVNSPKSDMHDYFGEFSAALLVKDGVDFEYIREQVRGRYAELNTELAGLGWKAVYHQAPYDQKAIASGEVYSNGDPEFSQQERERNVLYAILLLLPAINLSTLLHSRMRKRVNEIGVRRAFGCTRAKVIEEIISENFIFTLLGGFIGLALGIIFALTYSGLYENMESAGMSMTPAISAVINVGTILIAVAVCFILNLISAFVPAWQASRLNPVEAINAK